MAIKITYIRRGDSFQRERVFYNPLPLAAGETVVRPDLTSPIDFTGKVLKAVYLFPSKTIDCTVANGRLVVNNSIGYVKVLLSVEDTSSLIINDKGRFYIELTDGLMVRSILQRRIEVIEKWS